MPDTDTTVAQLRQIVEAFVSERDWRQFHTPKNLAMAMAIETAELMEHFQWLTPEQSRRWRRNRKLREVGEEVADVLCYLMAMANELGLDLDRRRATRWSRTPKNTPPPNTAAASARRPGPGREERLVFRFERRADGRGKRMGRKSGRHAPAPTLPSPPSTHSYIRSTTSIPSSSNPLRIVRAVRSQSRRRLRRTSSGSALITGHCS